MKKLKILIVVVLFSGCISPENQPQKTAYPPPEKSDGIFNVDLIGDIIDHSYDEIGFLPVDSKESKYCTWLESYKSLVEDRIVNSSNYNNEKFKVVGYAKLSADIYFVGYEENCEQANVREIPARVTKSLERIPGCPKPGENKFEPKSYSNCISKTHPDSEGAVSLIQVWHNEK